MRTITYNLGLLCLGFCLMAIAVAPAGAQQYPSRPITVVVPLPPGGPADTITRVMGPKLEARIKQRVIIENRPGGGTYTGGEYVARANPDGYTLLVNAYSGVQPHLFVKGLRVKLAEELVPVAPLAEGAYLVFGPASLAAKDLREFVAYAKANPKKLNAGVYPGTANSLELIAFMKSAGIDLVNVSYSSTTEIVAAMLRNEIHLYNGSISGAKAQIDAGKLKPFAVLSEQRDPAMSNVPTAKELGINWVSSVYYVVFAPPKTPAAVVKTLNEHINAAMREPDAMGRLAKLGVPVPPAATPEQMAARLKREYTALVQTAKDAGIEPQ